MMFLSNMYIICQIWQDHRLSRRLQAPVLFLQHFPYPQQFLRPEL